MSTAVRSSSKPRHQAARDLAALPSFVHSLDEFPYVEIVEPTMLSWSGDESSRRASEAKLAKVLKGSKKTIATSSSEEDEPPRIRRLRMTAMPDAEPTKPPALSAMPPLTTRLSTDSNSSASSCPLPTPRELRERADGYFGGRSSAAATPRAHRTPQASPSRRVARKASGAIAIAPCAPGPGPARMPGAGSSLPAQNAMPLCGPSPTSKRFTVGVEHEDDDSDHEEDSD
ncbi:hypothetical protein AURDEDRAFT_160322 [Auricularia subglabra TFB-10046 SS5]|nr:hypothetical protein AURDEDRAFT_160322 [Auricularia subglabra TFB-10046 SS5]